MERSELFGIVNATADGDYSLILSEIKRVLALPDCGPSWKHALNGLTSFIEAGKPCATIIAEGNGKLPFLAFSALPGKRFCPGAGDCLNFCYSFRAWRYPWAFVRQVQNTLLLNTKSGRCHITDAIDKQLSRKKYAGRVDFRLYVDGDFRSLADMAFWFDLISSRPRLKVYGYSKSFELFLRWSNASGRFPDNYLLNLSSGHRYDNATLARMRELSCVRGEFIAVRLGYSVKASMHGQRGHQANLRAAFGGKAFTCPGKCGACTNSGHACGSRRFNNVPIIIATH